MRIWMLRFPKFKKVAEGLKNKGCNNCSFKSLWVQDPKQLRNYSWWYFFPFCLFSLQDSKFLEDRNYDYMSRVPFLPSITCIFFCFVISEMVSESSCHLVLDRAGVVMPIYRRGNYGSDGSVTWWRHVANIHCSKACENNGYSNCFAIGRLAYAQLLDKDQHAREMEEPAPEILGDFRILS